MQIGRQVAGRNRNHVVLLHVKGCAGVGVLLHVILCSVAAPSWRPVSMFHVACGQEEELGLLLTGC